MTVRQISGDHRTVVEVLRAASEEYGDAEAYVEPATSASPRRHLTFAEWDRAADGRSRPPGHPRSGTRVGGVPLPAELDRLHDRIRRRRPAGRRHLGRQRSPRASGGHLDPRSDSAGRHPDRPWPHAAAGSDRPRRRPRVVGRGNGRSAARAVPRPRPRRSRRRGVDERDDRPAQGGRLRPRQPAGRRRRHRRPLATGRPSVVPVAVRSRRVDDPAVGRGGPRHHHGDHAVTMASGRGGGGHGRRAHHRGPRRAHPVGAGAGRAGPRRRRSFGSPHRGNGRLAGPARAGRGHESPVRRAHRGPLHDDRGVTRYGYPTRRSSLGGGDDGRSAGARGGARDRR